jgi:hypothetical protein
MEHFEKSLNTKRRAGRSPHPTQFFAPFRKEKVYTASGLWESLSFDESVNNSLSVSSVSLCKTPLISNWRNRLLFGTSFGLKIIYP